MGSPTTDFAVTSIRIEREKLDAFKRVAEANRRSVSQELRWLIDRHVLETEGDAFDSDTTERSAA